MQVINNYIRKFNPRCWSNDELKKLKNYLPKGARIVNISGWEDKDKEGSFYRNYFPEPKVYEISNYSRDKIRGVNAASNLIINLDEPLPEKYDGRYDIAFNHTVLEHVSDPVFAFAQIAKLTTDMMITIVPFKQPLHFESSAYGDYYRFTPFSMRQMHKKNGFTVLYESYTPLPTLDVYLLYVGTRQKEKYDKFPIHVHDINTFNNKIGNTNVKALFQNILARFIAKYLCK